MLQELDRFMAICWDRIGVPPPDHERNQSENGGGSRGSNPLANILTPGRCVPALIFVIERVPIIAPWHEAGASESQIVEVSIVSIEPCHGCSAFYPSNYLTLGRPS
jgi:hypothetical protein